MNSPVELTTEQIKAVGKTSLRRLNKMPLVYKYYASNMPGADQRVLDYGCGKHPVCLPSRTRDVVRYDICHFPERPKGPFDVVLVSNVLNVLPSRMALVQTIGDIVGLMKPNGVVVANFPATPRKGRMQDGSVIDHNFAEVLLRLALKDVYKSSEFGTPSAPLFICYGRK